MRSILLQTTNEQFPPPVGNQWFPDEKVTAKRGAGSSGVPNGQKGRKMDRWIPFVTTLHEPYANSQWLMGKIPVGLERSSLLACPKIVED